MNNVQKGMIRGMQRVPAEIRRDKEAVIQFRINQMGIDDEPTKGAIRYQTNFVFRMLNQHPEMWEAIDNDEL